MCWASRQTPRLRRSKRGTRPDAPAARDALTEVQSSCCPATVSAAAWISRARIGRPARASTSATVSNTGLGLGGARLGRRGLFAAPLSNALRSSISPSSRGLSLVKGFESAPLSSITSISRGDAKNQSVRYEPRPSRHVIRGRLASIHRFAGGGERFALQGVVNELQVLRRGARPVAVRPIALGGLVVSISRSRKRRRSAGSRLVRVISPRSRAP